MGLNLKKINIFKVIITVFMLVTFTVSVMSCQEVPVVEEQQIKAEDEIVIPPETKEETTPAEEETPNDTALETILKEKVSFISEALPGAELNTKTGELT